MSPSITRYFSVWAVQPKSPRPENFHTPTEVICMKSAMKASRISNPIGQLEAGNSNFPATGLTVTCKILFLPRLAFPGALNELVSNSFMTPRENRIPNYFIFCLEQFKQCSTSVQILSVMALFIWTVCQDRVDAKHTKSDNYSNWTQTYINPKQSDDHLL